MRHLWCLAGLIFSVLSLNGQEGPNSSTDLVFEHIKQGTDSLIYQRISSINTTRNEYAPQVYQDGILFLSDRGSLHHLGSIYTATEIVPGEYSKPALDEPKYKGSNIAGITYSKDQQTRIISLAKVKTSKKKLAPIFYLYQSQKVKNKWTKPRKLTLNTKGYSATYPHLSADGKRLYFVSNRPGGFGDTDIYVAHLQGKKWTDPINLGGEVNTAEAETTPFVDQLDNLYFASNGHGGYGKLDIFRAVISDSVSTTIQKPINLGQGFNSRRDDFGFVQQMEESTGFFCSNRAGGAGGEDIFAWELILQETTVSIPEESTRTKTIALFDKQNSNPLTEVAIAIQVDGKEQWEEETDSLGNISIDIAENHDYIFTIKRKGYVTSLIQVSTVELMGDGKYYIGLERSACQLLNGRITASDGTKGIAQVKVNFWNRCTETSDEVFTNEKGDYTYCAMCDCVFLVTMTRNGYYLKTQNVNTEDRECQFNQPMKLDFTMDVLLPEETEGGSPAMVELAAEANDKSFTRLTNVYYAFNSTALSVEAKEELDDWIRELRLDSSLQIQVMSHTDSRGKASYNQYLSQQRAEEVATYFQQNGINAQRIRASGMGERDLLNDCDDKPCAEKEHRLNRRTEIRVWRSKGLADIPTSYETSGNLSKTITKSLPTIYYGFESHALTKESKETLMEVRQLLEKEAAIQIEIRAHTDSRGPAAYNLALSQKRAEEVVQFLVSQGIEAERLIAKGYGESTPLNNCKDATPCSPAAHRINRRTELIIRQ